MSPFSFAILVINFFRMQFAQKQSAPDRVAAFLERLENIGLTFNQLGELMERTGTLLRSLMEIKHQNRWFSKIALETRISQRDGYGLHAMGLAQATLICFFSEAYVFDEREARFILSMALFPNDDIVEGATITDLPDLDVSKYGLDSDIRALPGLMAEMHGLSLDYCNQVINLLCSRYLI